MENKKITLTYPPGLTFSEMVDFFTGEFLGNKSIVDFLTLPRHSDVGFFFYAQTNVSRWRKTEMPFPLIFFDAFSSAFSAWPQLKQTNLDCVFLFSL